MKNISLLLFSILSFSINLFGQQATLSKYERADVMGEGEYYAKLLAVDSKKQLLLKINDYKFIVFKDSIVHRFYVNSGKVVSKKQLSVAETLMSLKMLDVLKSVNPYNLNVTIQANSDNFDDIEDMDVQDGMYYRYLRMK